MVEELTHQEPDLEALQKLLDPFPESWLSKLPKPTKKDNPKGRCPDCDGWHGLPAIHIDYVGHADLTRRLLEVDPLWNWEPFSLDANGLPMIDKSSSEWNLWIHLTVGGMTRIGVGNVAANEHDALKQLIGDALRNAAMRFGAALDLWSKNERKEAEIVEHSSAPTRDPLAEGWESADRAQQDVSALSDRIKNLDEISRKLCKEETDRIGVAWPPTKDQWVQLDAFIENLTSQSVDEMTQEAVASVEKTFEGTADVSPPKPASPKKVQVARDYLDKFKQMNELGAVKAVTKYLKTKKWPLELSELTDEQVDEILDFMESL